MLCNNAGVGGNTAVAAMSYPLWDLILGVNLGGTVNGIQTFVPRMIARGEPGHALPPAVEGRQAHLVERAGGDERHLHPLHLARDVLRRALDAPLDVRGAAVLGDVPLEDRLLARPLSPHVIAPLCDSG